jgi:predicted lipase
MLEKDNDDSALQLYMVINTYRGKNNHLLCDFIIIASLHFDHWLHVNFHHHHHHHATRHAGQPLLIISRQRIIGRFLCISNHNIA